MEINLNPGFFLPASEYFRRHKDVQKRHSGSLSPLLEALAVKAKAKQCFINIANQKIGDFWQVEGNPKNVENN